jgi:3-hydroxybutyryl-CoA dehydrogenase
MAIEHVVIVGGGVMGNGIAQVVAQAGLRVTLVDISDEALEGARGRIGKSLDRLVARERLSAGEAAAVMSRIATTTDLKAAAARSRRWSRTSRSRRTCCAGWTRPAATT